MSTSRRKSNLKKRPAPGPLSPVPGPSKRRSSRSILESSFASVTTPQQKRRGRIDSTLEESIRNDDDTERHSSRNVLNFSHAIETPSRPQIADSDINQHVELCARLYTENKINIKNAWKLNVIDAIIHIVQKGRANVFQAAGASLDVGAKVYGCRVDDIHQRGLQMVSNLGTRKQAPSAEEEAGEEAAQNVTKAKRARRIVQRATFLVEDVNQLLASNFGSEEDSISLTKETINDVGVTNIINFKMRIGEDTQSFESKKNTKFWRKGGDVIDEEENELGFNDIPMNCFLAAPFKDLNFGLWNPEDDEVALAADDSQASDAPVDDDGHLFVDLDGSIPNIFNAPSDPEQSDHEEAALPAKHQTSQQIETIADLISQGNVIETDYGFELDLDVRWFGPSHWKTKLTHKVRSIYTGSVEVRAPMAKRKKHKKTKFDSFEVIEELFQGEMPKARIRHRDLSNNLAWDMSLSSDDKVFLLTKPRVTSRKELQIGDNNEIDDEIGENSDNDDNAPMDMAEHSYEEIQAQAGELNEVRENLTEMELDAEEMIFARHAKKLDMKHLKDGILRTLMIGTSVMKSSFKKLYKKLPETIPAQSRSELTPHLALVALLHCCNEKGILLTDKGKHDFGIQSYK